MEFRFHAGIVRARELLEGKTAHCKEWQRFTPGDSFVSLNDALCSHQKHVIFRRILPFRRKMQIRDAQTNVNLKG
jgi:hypothetical protein